VKIVPNALIIGIFAHPAYLCMHAHTHTHTPLTPSIWTQLYLVWGPSFPNSNMQTVCCSREWKRSLRRMWTLKMWQTDNCALKWYFMM